MSEENKDEPKKLKGFANPELRKNINRKGKPTGVKNKRLSNEALEELIVSNCPEAISTMVKLMRTGSNSEKVKVSAKILDLTIEIIRNDEKLGKGKLVVTKEHKDGSVSIDEFTDIENKELTPAQMLRESFTQH